MMRSTSSEALDTLDAELERLHLTPAQDPLLPVVPALPEMVIPAYVYRRRNGVPNIEPPKLTSQAH